MRAKPRPLFQTCYMASHTSNISPPPFLQTWIRPCTLMTSQTQQIPKSRCLQTTVLYRTIKSDTDHHRLQTDLDKLSEWAMAWDMHSTLISA